MKRRKEKKRWEIKNLKKKIESNCKEEKKEQERKR